MGNFMKSELLLKAENGSFILVHPPICLFVCLFSSQGLVQSRSGPRVPTDLRYMIKILKFGGGGGDEPSLIVVAAMIQEMDRSVSNQNGTEQKLRKQVLKAPGYVHLFPLSIAKYSFKNCVRSTNDLQLLPMCRLICVGNGHLPGSPQ